MGGGWGASAGWVEVWWRCGGGSTRHAHLARCWRWLVAGWWCWPWAPAIPRVAHPHPPLVAAGHCSLSRHLVTSVLTAPLRPRSHQALLRLRLAEVCCWWPRGRGSSRWMAGCGTSSQPPSRGHCTLYTVHCTLYSWPGRCTPEVGCQTPAGGWWWLECPDNVITTLSLLPAHIFSTLLP